MSKFQINHVSLMDKGAFGPWGYALCTPRSELADISDIDVFELRGVDRQALEAIASALPAIKGKGLALCFEADVRTEVRHEEFTTRTGEAASKTVLRVYMKSEPKWSQEATTVSLGNLNEVLGLNEDTNPPF